MFVVVDDDDDDDVEDADVDAETLRLVFQCTATPADVVGVREQPVTIQSQNFTGT